MHRSLIEARRLTDHVTTVGESTDPAGWFAWSDVLLHPSLYEGYPRVVAEALGCGVPVVCAETAHAPVGEGVLHARPLDPASLQAAVLRALSAPRPPHGGRPTVSEVRIRDLYRLVTSRDSRTSTAR